MRLTINHPINFKADQEGYQNLKDTFDRSTFWFEWEQSDDPQTYWDERLKKRYPSYGKKRNNTVKDSPRMKPMTV